ncbi:hypothetical protein BH23CHL5_BH23CHL5_27360 [soil metagenome]
MWDARTVTEPESGADGAMNETLAQAIAAVAALPIDQRKVLTVAVASDLTYVEIAEQGGFEQSTVLSWMRGGLHAIAQALDATPRWIEDDADQGPAQ